MSRYLSREGASMKSIPLYITLAICFIMMVIPFTSFAQSGFSAEKYSLFLEQNANLDFSEASDRYAPKTVYYRDMDAETPTEGISYLDSMQIKYELTDAEIELLEKNHFVITERLSHTNFCSAMADIYHKDLPVFVSTDAILHALHKSYDDILMDLERTTLQPNLRLILNGMYDSIAELAESSDFPKIIDNPEIQTALEDLDLYITVAKSLLDENKAVPHYTTCESLDTMLSAIESEQLVKMPLFCEKDRNLDFSQFTVRGHYAETDLEPYFKCMMWLGRIDFMLTAAPTGSELTGGEEPWTEEDLKRMAIDAVLLNQLLDYAGVRESLEQNDEILTFMIGESDNLTPAELQGIGYSVADLFDDTRYDAFIEALTSTEEYQQRILSNFFTMDPYSSEPDQLPVSFRLMGQRFIIDSYIFSNVVYDRIIYEGQKIWRPMPDPLDAMFVLGNDNALHLLQNELEEYKYASQLASLRYLTDAYDEEFWNLSLYNSWLQAIRTLNPLSETDNLPLFMQTAAWHQQKLNTQLASWAQLRHDNLLYAKQSFTAGGATCSFPHSYVEPYPEFYRQIAAFAEKAELYFTNDRIKKYFSELRTLVTKLEIVAEKELAQKPLDDDEIEFLQTMLYDIEGGCKAAPEKASEILYLGWYRELFYNNTKADEPDYIVADVHTQPTDKEGNIVGNVLHVGVGKINLGIFIAECPNNGYEPMAFVGPVMSYYETTTSGFDRLTDQEWAKTVREDALPHRPDWVNIYLADRDGGVRSAGRVLPSQQYVKVYVEEETVPEEFAVLQNYPNPFNPVTTITYTLPTDSATHVKLNIYDIRGALVTTLFDRIMEAGNHSQSVIWDGTDTTGKHVSSGIYFYKLQAGEFTKSNKMILIR